MKVTKVNLSENETEVLGFRVGRCNTDELNEIELQKKIIDLKLDLCRLKLPAEEEYASIKLTKTGFPFFFSGSIRRYKTRISQIPEGKFNHPDVEYIAYDGTQDQLFKEILTDTWGTYPLGYYRSPYIQHIATKEIEIETVYRFYKKNNLSPDKKNNTIMFMMEKGKCVGFFALNRVDGNLESHIGGIHSEHRKGGYFLDMLRYIQIHCVKNKLPYFLFGARNENAEVQKIFQQVGFKAYGCENVFHITPLLNYNSEHKSKTFSVNYSNRKRLQTEAFRILNEQFAEKHKNIQNFSFTFIKELKSNQQYFFKISNPINTKETSLNVLKLIDENRSLSAIAYCHND